MLLPSARSRYRQEIGKKIRRISWLASRCLFLDPLIQGSPYAVFKTCGRKGCECAKGGEYRHGPYPVLHVSENRRQRQVSISKGDREVWDQAKHYAYQLQRLEHLKIACLELQGLVREVIQKRITELPPEKKMRKNEHGNDPSPRGI